MYIVNHFVFGHNLNIDKTLNELLLGFGFDFQKTINNKTFEYDEPYHGGRVRGDIFPIIFGCIVTDDDQDDSQSYINDIRNAKEEDYLIDYNIFLESFIDFLKSEMGIEEDYDNATNKLIEYITTTKPNFYTVESSS